MSSSGQTRSMGFRTGPFRVFPCPFHYAFDSCLRLRCVLMRCNLISPSSRRTGCQGPSLRLNFIPGDIYAKLRAPVVTIPLMCGYFHILRVIGGAQTQRNLHGYVVILRPWFKGKDYQVASI